MDTNSILDLDLAGIRWELNEFPNVLAKKSTADSPEIKSVSPSPLLPINTDAIRKSIGKIKTLDELNAVISELNHPLKMFSKNTIIPRGTGRVLVLTDAPTTEDDANGFLFSGIGGELFDKMIGAIELSRDNVALASVVFWRPPGGRAPTDLEIVQCRPFLDKFIEITKPEFLLTFGDVSAGYEFSGEKFSVPSVQTLIQNPSLKKDAWEILQKLLKKLK